MRRPLSLLLGLLPLLGLAACSGGAAAGPSREPAHSTSPAPVILTSCGVSSAARLPVHRLVTLKSSITETVVALGAADRLVGVGALDGSLPRHVTGVPDAVWEVDLPVIAADGVPSFEAVAELAPDAILAGWESNLSDDGAGERARWEELGVATWVSPSACRDARFQPDALTFDDVFAQIRQIGRVVGEPAAAEQLIAAQRAELAQVEPVRDVTALWWSSGRDTPFVGGGIGAPQLIMDSAGITNVAAAVDDTWTSMSWEAVAEADPQWLILVDAAWNTAEQKRAALAANPVTAAMDAVVHERFLVVDFPATESGVRNADAVVSLVGQLTEAR